MFRSAKFVALIRDDERSVLKFWTGFWFRLSLAFNRVKFVENVKQALCKPGVSNTCLEIENRA